MTGASEKKYNEKRGVYRINPDTEIETIEEYLTEANALRLISGCDVVLDALDNIESRKLLANACARAKVPLIYGAVQGWVSQAAVSMPRDGLVEALYPRDILRKDKSVLSFTPALCVKLLVGRPAKSGTIFYFDLLNQEFETIPMV